MALYNLQINGKAYRADVDPDTPLLWVLRDNLGLVGTKYGCGIAQCGACTVHLNGEATRSCVLPVSAVGKGKVITIEGLAATTGTGNMHPVQKAWDDIDVPQCGYCQAGQIMTAAAFLKHTPKPTTAQIDEAMSGNICRCGTYHRIREAVKVASTASASAAPKSTKTK
ncbi:(2Fe-2S)-binding protein [Fibrivirga algicola]|uniref:(2Fe-2S)-binding protein n=1 Tax=Fibrivirga algicola TaxID=2950420 RepID=A0ABX0Q995_9BACT|nr:(2Fe-2S)-binding protein [Fibrivirga algicola]ARK09249.1 (2Fe-2S)-binding protein [Fibrella sp. ES10-3-2-2]NID08634.1 (2Fe-2S)-binding protein [Fibrivirga algicola]